MPCDKLAFYDVKDKHRFESSDYRTEIRNGRKFAVAKGPSGIDCWRVLGRA